MENRPTPGESQKSDLPSPWTCCLPQAPLVFFASGAHTAPIARGSGSTLPSAWTRRFQWRSRFPHRTTTCAYTGEEKQSSFPRSMKQERRAQVLLVHARAGFAESHLTREEATWYRHCSDKAWPSPHLDPLIRRITLAPFSLPPPFPWLLTSI